MQATSVRRSIGVGTLFVIMGVSAFMLFQGRARGQANAPAAEPKMTQTPLFDNSRVTVRIDHFPVGIRQPMHTAGTAGDNRDVLMILLTPAQFEGVVDGKKSVSDKAGTVWECPGAPSQHAFANLSNQPVDVMVVQLK